MSNGQKFFFSFLAGATIGTIAGLLLAPESGKVTRKKIADKAKELKGDLEESWDSISERFGDTRSKEKDPD